MASDDISRLTAEFVEQLRAKGQHVASATVTHGAENDVSEGAKYVEWQDKPTE